MSADGQKSIEPDPEGGPRIALLTPYTGHNLGDASIQDALIANLRLRLPGAHFSGITLNCDNFVERHGAGSFPLCGSNRPFYGMCHGRLTDQPVNGCSSAPSSGAAGGSSWKMVKHALKQLPGLWSVLKALHSFGRRAFGEMCHSIQGYRFLRTQDLLVVSGGGQLDDEWGGAWGHPFALAKWAVLARIARVPYAVTSVGACKIESRTGRLFLSAALRLAQYRSYRDKHSKQAATALLREAADDPVVPDLAFSLPRSELPPPAGIRNLARDRLVVGISPIAYAKPGVWARENANVYDRYVQELAQVISHLLQRGYFLIIVWSGLGDDDRLIPEILERLDNESSRRAVQQIHIPKIGTWRDLVGLLQDVDLFVASRLHSTILGFVTQTPTVAISFDPKVDWVMEDLGQTDYLLQILDFKAEDVVKALDRMKLRQDSVEAQIRSYQLGVRDATIRQFDTLAELAEAARQHRN